MAMARKITLEMLLDDVEDEVIFTRAATKADPDAADLLHLTDGWLPLVDDCRAADRELRIVLMEITAERAVANGRLDPACVTFGDALYLACGKDRSSPRWRMFFDVAVSVFVRQALSSQVARVRGWLTSAKDPVLDEHRAPLDRWSKAAADALDRTSGTAVMRGQVQVKREELATSLTRERDGFRDALAARARERGLARDWPDLFFRTTPSRGAAAAEEPEAPAPTV
jgi:hypothetical protein